jgi:plasmid stabilization system protein ParE
VKSRVVWSPLALRRAGEAADFIARDDRVAALRWAEGILEATRALGSRPRKGRIVPEVSRDDIRELVYGNPRVIYRVSPRRVEVLTVRHGRRLFDPREAGGEEQGRRPTSRCSRRGARSRRGRCVVASEQHQLGVG